MIDQNAFSMISFKTRDFEVIREAEAGWDQRYDLMDRGGFEGGIKLCHLGQRQLSEVYWGNRIRYQGIVPPGHTAMGLPIIQSAPGKWLGVDAEQDDVLIQRPGQQGDFVSPEKWRTLVLSTPDYRFSDLFSAISGTTDVDPNVLHGVFRVSPLHTSELRQQAENIFAAASTVSHTASQNNTSIQLTTQMLDAFETGFVWAVVHALENRYQSHASRSAGKIVQRAEEYANSVTHRQVSILELCQICEVGERTLHNAFNQRLDASPSSWLRALRLNRAYKTLRCAPPKRGLVKAVALEHGFIHFGRFAEHYSSFFGETPSETMARI